MTERPDRSSSLRFILGMLVTVAGAGILGFLIGSNSAGNEQEADDARAQSFHLARNRAQASASRRATAKGREVGIKSGRTTAVHAGTMRGGRDGRSKAALQEAAIATAEAEAAARAEAQERAENCGAPLFVEGYCPTDAEIEQENQAESEGGIP